MTQARGDWDFLLTLAMTALVIAGVVVVYMLVTYRRMRAAAEAARRAAEAAPAPGEADREPVFFKRYVPEETAMRDQRPR